MCGTDLKYDFCETPFGECFIVATRRGISRLEFDVRERSRAVATLCETARAVRAGIGREVSRVFVDPMAKLPSLDLHGTAFRLRVWEALLDIPPGQTRSYRQLAEGIGRPTAVRAVASAVAHNPIGFLVPCHRVIRADGRPGGYRWGVRRKQAMLQWEARFRWQAAS